MEFRRQKRTIKRSKYLTCNLEVRISSTVSDLMNLFQTMRCYVNLSEACKENLACRAETSFKRL